MRLSSEFSVRYADGDDRFDERETLLDEPPLGYGDDFEDGHLDIDD